MVIRKTDEHLLSRQKQLQEQHIQLLNEQIRLEKNLQTLTGIKQQLLGSESPVVVSSPFRSTVPIKTVKLFVTTLSNHFMLEIAQVFTQGFRKAGVTTKLLIDEIPSVIPNPEILQIIVAPHEFFPLFLEAQNISNDLLEKITRNVYLLNVEQPGSMWFEIAYHPSCYAQGVFDINQQGVQELQKRGIPVIHTPLGYDPSCFGLEIQPSDSDKAIDILFLGGFSKKREAFLSENADFLNRYNCSVILMRIERPNTEKTIGFYTGIERNQLLQSSKILVNIHSADRTYFEWHRILLAMGHSCLVVSENSDYIEPLIDGEHLKLAHLNEIPSICEYYLKNTQERLKIVNQAYQFVNHHHTIQQTCSCLLQQFYSPM